MSAEIIQIFKCMNRKELSTQLAIQCAPLLTGNKISNLFIIDASEKGKVIRLFSNTPIAVFVLYENDKKVTFLLYKRQELMHYLQNISVKGFMLNLGYKEMKLEYILRELQIKYSSHMTLKEEFPHELGIILEYPVEDVRAFIKNQGRNSIYVGYWKVYSNLAEALAIFEKYTIAKETLIRMVFQGYEIKQILEIYYPDYKNIKHKAV